MDEEFTSSLEEELIGKGDSEAEEEVDGESEGEGEEPHLTLFCMCKW